MERIDTATVADLRAGFERAFDGLASAIDAAAPAWDERILESEDPSADAWSPRLAAWHAIAGERIRAAYVGYLVSQRPSRPPDMMAFAATPDAGPASVDALRKEFRETQTPEAMRGALDLARRGLLDALQRLPDADLDVAAQLGDVMRTYAREHGQAPGEDVRGILLHGVVHLTDHGQQIARAKPA